MSDQRCGKDGVLRYTWPGKDEAFVCLEHADKLRAVANAIGLYLQLIATAPGQGVCNQVVQANKRLQADASPE